MTRKILMLLVLVAVGVGYWTYRHDAASKHIKTEMLAIVDEMDLTPVGREDVKQLIVHFHAGLFDRALDVGKRHGSKFNDKFYYDEMYRQVVEQLRADGDDNFADKVDRLKGEFSLAVTEK